VRLASLVWKAAKRGPAEGRAAYVLSPKKKAPQQYRPAGPVVGGNAPKLRASRPYRKTVMIR
jgi:hypothetical protein